MDDLLLEMKMNLVIALLICLLTTAGAQEIPSWKMKQVLEYSNKKSDSVYVINFWATFCKPCVAEIPYLQSITAKYAQKKVSLLLVSLDLPVFYPAAIAKFADKNKFSAAKVWLNESDADYFCPMIDPAWSGAIPATLFVNAASGYRHFIEKELTANEFEMELQKAIAGK